MTFKKEEVGSFLAHFDAKKNSIRGFRGCLGLDLLNDQKDDSVFFTYSIWDNDSSLQNYRQSELFKETWAFVKLLFAAKAEAYSMNLRDSI